jgi:hypothetical protein
MYPTYRITPTNQVNNNCKQTENAATNNNTSIIDSSSLTTDERWVVGCSKNMVPHYQDYKCISLSVADPDPGSGAF